MTRRYFLLASAAGLCTLMLGACRRSKAPEPAALTPEERAYRESAERMNHRFGRPGFLLIVDAMAGQEFFSVEFFAEHARHSLHRSGIQTLQNRATRPWSGPVPERVRIIWRDTDEYQVNDDGVTSRRAGRIIGDEWIEVGTRIPQALIDDLKRDPHGALRLKFRMSNQGTMLGWDIERRPGYDQTKAVEMIKQGEMSPYYPPVYSFAGGDFRERTWTDHDVNGQRIRTFHPGWYIDRQTGHKIETDY